MVDDSAFLCLYLGMFLILMEFSIISSHSLDDSLLLDQSGIFLYEQTSILPLFTIHNLTDQTKMAHN